MCWISDVFISTIIVQTCWLFESPIEVVAFSAGYTHATDQIKAKDACFLLVKPRPQTLIFRPSFCVIAAQIKGTNFDSPIEAAGSPFREVFDSPIEAAGPTFRELFDSLIEAAGPFWEVIDSPMRPPGRRFVSFLTV